MTNRILVYDVDTSMQMVDIRRDLVTAYKGIRYIRRLYSTENPSMPTNTLQIEFNSASDAENIITKGFINIGFLRCFIKPLKPAVRPKTEMKRNGESDRVSENSDDVIALTDRILVEGVSTDIHVEEFERELSNRYDGIQHVKRWHNLGDPQSQSERVEVRFRSSDDAKAILEDGFISIGQFYWPVRPLKPAQPKSSQPENHRPSEHRLPAITESDMLHMFAAQKKRLNELIQHFDAELTNMLRTSNQNAVSSASE